MITFNSIVISTVLMSTTGYHKKIRERFSSMFLVKISGSNLNVTSVHLLLNLKSIINFKIIKMHCCCVNIININGFSLLLTIHFTIISMRKKKNTIWHMTRRVCPNIKWLRYRYFPYGINRYFWKNYWNRCLERAN